MIDFLPGFIQGIVRVIISYPFDYIRTNIQTQKYNSISDFLRKNSFTKIYKGLYIPLLTIPIDRAIQFYIYEECNKKKYSVIQSSLISTALSSIYSIPINYLQTKIMTNTNINNANQYKGFYSDFTRIFLSSFLYLGIYGKLKENIEKQNHNYFVFGILSSAIMWSIVYPLDTIRVLKQTSDMTYSKILLTHNIRKLYSGLSIVILRSLPSSGCGMIAYEYTKNKIIEYKNEYKDNRNILK